MSDFQISNSKSSKSKDQPLQENLDSTSKSLISYKEMDKIEEV